MARLARLVLTTAILVLLGCYIAANYAQFRELQLMHPWLLVPASVLLLINIYGIGALMSTSLQPLGLQLDWHETLGLAALNRLCNYISFAGLGAAVRAVYLKRTYHCSYASFSSSFVANNIMLLLVSGILALIALTAGGILDGHWQLIMLLAAVVTCLAGTLLLPLNRLIRALELAERKYRYRVLERLRTAAEGFNKIRRQPSVVVRMSLWGLASLLTLAMATMLLYHCLGYSIAWPHALFIAAASSWSIVIALTPAGIGIREGLMVAAAALVEAPIPETLAVALLLRLLVFCVATALSAYYAPRLLRVPLTKIGKLRQ